METSASDLCQFFSLFCHLSEFSPLTASPGQSSLRADELSVPKSSRNEITEAYARRARSEGDTNDVDVLPADSSSLFKYSNATLNVISQRRRTRSSSVSPP
ncbi:hypothetical protein K0M31_017445 [Melipona bicolor]|uniref:Uncharacterized protein n=1 Tax=Melipona bicolor TaxID=60889 RepID=A0AA40G4V5_9HYME|nr:hypothetical protein K0M31_017445 [Melipona bicolor]